MPPVVGETVKPGGSNRRNIGRDLYRWTGVARGAFAISSENPGFYLFVAGAVAALLKVWFTNGESALARNQESASGGRSEVRGKWMRVNRDSISGFPRCGLRRGRGKVLNPGGATNRRSTNPQIRLLTPM
jgi:hypothetical protein